jgi:hypothetical protein
MSVNRARMRGEIDVLYLATWREVRTYGFKDLFGHYDKNDEGDSMDLADAVTRFNWLAIIAATVAAFVLGGAWLQRMFSVAHGFRTSTSPGNM